MNILTLYSTVIIALRLEIVNSARILAVVPFFSKSHHYMIQPIIRELAEKGHDITFITGIKLDGNHKNVKEIIIKAKLAEKPFELQNLLDLGAIPWFEMITFWPMGFGIENDTLQHPEVQKLIHSNEKYDLVMLETHFGQEAFLGFGYKFKAPVISLVSFSSFIFIDEFVGNPFGTAYIPGIELPYTSKMSFIQRLHNTVRVISTMLYGYFFYLPHQDSIMRQYFNYTDVNTIPSTTEMLQEIALVIVNSQISIDYPRAWVPNVIGIAGLHIKPSKPLPKDIRDFLENSKHGVIYVSFGSVVPIEQMPSEVIQTFVNTFSKLKQNVMWKIGLENIPGLSNNVKIGKWFPQQDILAHPKCIAFVTHGGLLSQQEAVYNGVPLVGIPFFGDQYYNAERAAAAGFGITLYNYNLTEASLLWAVNEVVNNPTYRQIIKKHSEIFKDNPQKPLDKALYWIEYVLKYNGAPHLRSHARKLSWYQYLLLDVMAFICLILFLILLSIYLILKFICSCFVSKKQPVIKSSKKRN